MNLIHDPWIPVLFGDGRHELVSLDTLFRDSDRIRDLSATPPQRIALMRLLICIVQAALDGPENEEDWLDCRLRIVPAACDYLETRVAKFDLFGPNPFLQIGDLEVTAGKDNDKAVDKLALELAHGYNNALFDNGTCAEGRVFPNRWKGVNLLTFLNFCPGGKVGQAVWKGVPSSDSTFAAPCLDIAHTYVLGATILETIHYNLLTKNGQSTGIVSRPMAWGAPVWDVPPAGPRDADAMHNALQTYLGRLVPLSRLIRLQKKREGRRCIVGPLPQKYKLERLPLYREPAATIKTSKGGAMYYLNPSPDKHIWRELGAILSLSADEKENVWGPCVLGRIKQLHHLFGNDVFSIWVGGLATGKSAAKLADALEWTFTLNMELLGDTSLRIYQTGVDLANTGATVLRSAAKTYWLKLQQTEHVNMKEFSKRIQPVLAKVELQYWSLLDNQYQTLIEIASDNSRGLNSGWSQIVTAAMREAYVFACPHKSPRQIQAYAQGLRGLHLKKSRAETTERQ